MASKKYYYRLSRTGKQWIVVATSLYLLWLGINKFFYGAMYASVRSQFDRDLPWTFLYLGITIGCALLTGIRTSDREDR